MVEHILKTFKIMSILQIIHMYHCFFPRHILMSCFGMFLKFYFEILLDLLKEFLHTLQSTCPNLNLLQNHGVFIETKTLTLI